MDCPRIVIAGTHSGVGKTSLSVALVAALRKQGFRVQTYKVGPDFLDPSYLTLASGRPCYNLDGWMAGKDYVRQLFARTSDGADMAVIEGVMGLYDGADPTTSEGSTAEIARWLEAPVLLVVSAHGIARSLGAVVKGYASFEPGIKVVGVIANQCGSEHHSAWLAEALRASSLPPLIAAIPQGILPHLPSRHLGLITANPQNLSLSVLDALAEAFESYGSIDDVLKFARSSPPLQISPFERQALPEHIRIGVAYDSAFHFYYQDLFDELQWRGCELIRFSPMEDSHLPEKLDALYIGGGYPEEYAETLSANQQLLYEVRKFASSGRPIYAECGGLIYLSQGLKALDGKQYPLVGLLPTTTRMLDRRKSLGYVEVTLKENSLWGGHGTTLRGHEFHYSELTTNPNGNANWRTVYSMRRRRSDDALDEGFQHGRVLASYVHLHLASHPETVKHFMANCGANL